MMRSESYNFFAASHLSDVRIDDVDSSTSGCPYCETTNFARTLIHVTGLVLHNKVKFYRWVDVTHSHTKLIRHIGAVPEQLHLCEHGLTPSNQATGPDHHLPHTCPASRTQLPSHGVKAWTYPMALAPLKQHSKAIISRGVNTIIFVSSSASARERFSALFYRAFNIYCHVRPLWHQPSVRTNGPRRSFNQQIHACNRHSHFPTLNSIAEWMMTYFETLFCVDCAVK